MTEFDREYLKLVKKILEEGVEVENRTGINTIKIPEYSFKFDLREEDPILTTKQFFARQAITEMLWIWQMASNDVRELHKRNVHIWDEWMIDEDGIYRIYEPYATEFDPDKEVEVIDPLSVPVSDPFGLMHEFKPKLDDKGNVIKAKSLKTGKDGKTPKNIKAAKWYGKEYAYTIGTAYGFIVNRYDHTRMLIESIKNYPQTDRRKVKSLWQDEFLRTAVLPSCVWSTEWNVLGDELSLMVHQRSCDVGLGLPFNVTQYACLLKMIAQVTGLKPTVISYSINDPHIYVNEIDGMLEQLRREKQYDKFSRLSRETLLMMKYDLEIKMGKYRTEHQELIEDIDKAPIEYKIMESDYRIIDMILEPVKPELWINPDIDDFFKFDNSKDLKDAKVKKYKHMGKISMEVAQ